MQTYKVEWDKRYHSQWPSNTMRSFSTIEWGIIPRKEMTNGHLAIHVLGNGPWNVSHWDPHVLHYKTKHTQKDNEYL